jgi:hypothetical protein
MYRKKTAVVAMSLALGVLPVTAQAAENPEDCAVHQAHMTEPGHIGSMASTNGGQHIAQMAQMGHDGHTGLGHMASMYGRSKSLGA